jgi:hypothetical protein
MKPPTITLLFAFIFFAITGSVPAAIWLDPEAPMTWDAMLACELVVKAKYESHSGSELKLKVLEVLKGNAEQGQVLTIKLQHLYTVETGAVGWDTMVKREDPPDAVPKLCYKQQLTNPGDLVPASLLDDAREPAIYFFSKAGEPAIKRLGQVQPAEQQQGWQQALDGRPMALLFRLTQDTNKELARDALEELGKTRDPACLDQLFAWLLSPDLRHRFATFQCSTILARLGDKSGDVYDRAARRLTTAAPCTNEYRFYPLANLMVRSDERRARTDLPSLIVNKELPLPVRNAAVVALGGIATRSAAQLVLDCFRDAELGEAATSAARQLLHMDIDYEFPKRRGLDDRNWLLDEIRKAGNDEATPTNVKKNINEWFGHMLRSTQPVDAEQLRQRLLDPQDRTYQGWADGKTADMLRQARDECDPRLIPMLVEVLDKMPQTWGNKGYGFQDTLKRYALICPRFTGEELKKRGLPDRLGAMPSYERSHIISDVMELANLWPSRFRSTIHDEVNDCLRLGVFVRDGKVDESVLLQAVDRLIAKHGLSGLTCQALKGLTDAGTRATRERFFKFVGDARQPRVSQFFYDPRLGDISSLLHHLFPDHTQDYVEQVLQLLRSNSLLERKAGVSSLAFTLQCDFDFDPEALEEERSRRLNEFEPWLNRLIGKSETEVRVILLSRAGTQLTGEPNDSWLVPLAAAASAPDSPAVPQALRLIEIVVEEKRCHQFGSWPQRQRALAIHAYLRDAGKLSQ